MGSPLSAERRETLAALADALVPGADGMPSASAAGVPDRFIDRAVGSRPDLVDDLVATLDAARGADPAAFLAQLEREQPERLASLQLLVAGSWLMSPRTRKRIGYPGQVKSPVPPDEAEFFDEAALVEPVRARGFAYVDPDREA